LTPVEVTAASVDREEIVLLSLQVVTIPDDGGDKVLAAMFISLVMVNKPAEVLKVLSMFPSVKEMGITSVSVVKTTESEVSVKSLVKGLGVTSVLLSASELDVASTETFELTAVSAPEEFSAMLVERNGAL